MKTRPTLLAALAAVACALAPPAAAATADRVVPHIAGGTPLTDSTAAPWAALLEVQTTRGIQQICSANVVNATTVLTAAHCVVQRNRIIPGTSFRIQVGGVQRDQPGVQVVQGAGVAVHPSYRGFRRGYDVAVITLAGPLDFSTPLVQPIPVVGPNAGPNQREQLTFHGWGRTERGAPEGLKGMTTRRIATALCATGQPGILCARNPRQAPCRGDSGGGLVSGQAAGRPQLVGIDSFGGQTCKPSGGTDGFADLAQPAINSWLGGVFTGVAVTPGAGPRARVQPRVQRVSSRTYRLRCSSARWSGSPTVTTEWRYASNGKVLARTKRPFYTAKRRDIGKTIVCVSNAVNANGSTGVASRTGYRFFR